MKALAPEPDLIEVQEVDLEARVQSMQMEIMSRIHIGEDPNDKALHNTVKSDVTSQPLEMSEDGNLILLGDSRFLTSRLPGESENLMKVLTALKKIDPAHTQERKEDDAESDGHEPMNWKRRPVGGGPDSEAGHESDVPSTPYSLDDDSPAHSPKMGTYTMDSNDDERQNIQVETGTTPLSMFAETKELWYG
jgi:hypothetical protein